MTDVPVIYELDEVDGESTGMIHWFCCSACRDDGAHFVEGEKGYGVSTGASSRPKPGLARSQREALPDEARQRRRTRRTDTEAEHA